MDTKELKDRIRRALRNLNPIGERKAGMTTQASVTARPRIKEGRVMRNRWIIEKYSPVPYEELVAMVGEAEAKRVRTLERNGGLFVTLREIALAFGKATASALRSPPDWMTEIPHNNVVHEGLDHSLNQHLKGSAYTAAWYIGLMNSSPTVADGDTMASHAGWEEIGDYDEVQRAEAIFGTVSGQSVDNSASKGTFTMNAGTNVGGAFLVSGDGGTAIDGTNGTLYGGGAFTGGDRTLSSGDTINVSITCTAGTA